MTIDPIYSAADGKRNTSNTSSAHKRSWHATKYMRSSDSPSESPSRAKRNKPAPKIAECTYCHAPMQAEYRFCPLCGKEKGWKPIEHRTTKGLGYAFRRGEKWYIRLRIGNDNVSKGGFATKKEALSYSPTLRKMYDEKQAARRAPHNEYADITFAELYSKMMDRDKTRIVASTLNCYRAAYRYFEDIYRLPFSCLNTEDFQICIDDCPLGHRTKENMKALGTKMYKYANELCVFGTVTNTDYAKFVWIDRADRGGTRNPFTEEDLKKLKVAAMEGIPNADILLTMCATGFRPSEFLTLKHESYDPECHTLRGGAKTDAGKNRIVPVHPLVLKTVEKAYASGTQFLFNPENHDLRYFRENIFYPCLDAAGIQKISPSPRLTPYSTRHTFSTLMKKIPGSAKDKAALMGHTSYEMTLHYQHEDFDSLKEIINHIQL